MSDLQFNAAVTCDIVIVRPGEHEYEVLMVRRGAEPFEGRWALPGGFVDEGEDLRDCAARELAEETGLEIPAHDLEQIGAWGTPGRDPRGRTVSVVFFRELHPDDPRSQHEPRGGDDAAEAAWREFGLNQDGDVAGLDPAFDHLDILQAAVDRLRMHGD